MKIFFKKLQHMHNKIQTCKDAHILFFFGCRFVFLAVAHVFPSVCSAHYIFNQPSSTLVMVHLIAFHRDAWSTTFFIWSDSFVCSTSGNHSQDHRPAAIALSLNGVFNLSDIFFLSYHGLPFSPAFMFLLS